MLKKQGYTAADRAMAALVLRRRERQRRLESYRDYPEKYARDELGYRLSDDQEAMLRSYAENRRTAVKASHAIGKSFLAAIAANHWFDCWDQHIVYITAPTWGQAFDRTFKQIKIMRREHNLPGLIQETGKVKDDDKLKELGHFIQALNAETGEGFQGEHTAPILIIMEEAVGVKPYMWQAAEGMMTHPSNRILAIANPTDENTHFGYVCNDPKESRLWNIITVSVFSHPNIAAELECLPAVFPNAVTLKWLSEMLAKNCEVIGENAGEAFEFWTIDTIEAALEGTPVSRNHYAEKCFYLPNAEFQGRALGVFPTQADEQVVPRAWLDMLAARGPLPIEGVPAVGCDPARSGSDRTAVAGVVGPCVVSLREARQMSLEAVTGVCIDEARNLSRVTNISEYDIVIRIDITGGLGAGPADALEAQGYTVEGVNFSEAAKKHKEFPNRRSEVWWEVRERARTRDFDLSHLPSGIRASLVRELTTPKVSWDRKGKRIVQEKKEIRKELGMSPDLAEAVCLAYAPSRMKKEYNFRRTSVKGWF